MQDLLHIFFTRTMVPSLTNLFRESSHLHNQDQWHQVDKQNVHKKIHEYGKPPHLLLCNRHTKDHPNIEQSKHHCCKAQSIRLRNNCSQAVLFQHSFHSFHWLAQRLWQPRGWQSERKSSCYFVVCLVFGQLMIFDL